MATAQKVTNWFYLQKVSSRFIFKVRKFQVDNLNRFRMVLEKQEGAYFTPTPGKIGLREFIIVNWKLKLINVQEMTWLYNNVVCLQDIVIVHWPYQAQREGGGGGGGELRGKDDQIHSCHSKTPSHMMP